MNAAAWLARFADAERLYLAERDERHARIGAPPAVKVVVGTPVVLEPVREVESDSRSGVPVGARRVVSAALAAGWQARVTRAVAAVGKVGLVTSYAVRARRHDERLWACWWQSGTGSASFNAAQYFMDGMPCPEILGADAMATWAPGVVAVEAMTIDQIKSLAIDRGIKIPSKYKKAAIVEHVKAQGLIAVTAPKPKRGVVDAIEGRRLQ